MNVKDFKNTLSELNELTFVLPNGSHIAPHFHLTEVGEITKSYVDCGGSVRLEKTANFQLWTAHDYDHRLKPRKVIEIIEMAEKEIGLQNLDIEVEYQSETIGRYGLEFEEDRFILTATHTDCLSKEKCGIPEAKPVNLIQMESPNSCYPGGGCC
ncbi:MAG: hypothetical protein CMI24_09750 [Opitutae bacterium]|nr:hypothetical protein [Opitutae bacterium]MEC8421030.1 DUF6428 family protein [Verrucomicrobiota bacterium]